MRLDRSELSKAVNTALSLGAVAAVGVAGTAMAQNATPDQSNQQQPQTLQTIVVTGSHIRRVDLETSNPVVAISAQEIQATGKLTLGDVVQSLPVITGGVENPRVNNGGGSGATNVGLRGLGAQRTLILIDGARLIGLGGVADLNVIPAAAVERIEVLTDGASAVYGSDAIGGVVNIILKSNYQGAQFQLNYGISDHDDGARRGASFVFGQTSDKGSILAGVSYNKFDGVLQSARDWSKDALSASVTANGGLSVSVGGSTFAARDFISVDPALAAQFGCSSDQTLSLNPSAWTNSDAPTTNADYHCFGTQPGDKYNYAAVNLLMTPQERTNGFFKGTYHLTDNIDFYGTVIHNKTSSGFQLAPAVFGTATVAGVTISKDSYYNPFGVDFSGTSGALYRSRLYPSGNRAAQIGTTTDFVNFGFRGHFNVLDRDWTWDVGYNYVHISQVNTLLGLPDQSKILPGLQASFLNADGVVQCGTPADPISLADCTPWNALNLNSPSAQSVLASAASPALTNLYQTLRTEHADISGGLFDLPAGTMQLAAGVSYSKRYRNNTVDPVLILNPATGTCTLGSQCSAHTQGGYTTKEAYAELFVPILKDLPFVHALNVTLGDRYSKYSTFGSTNNWKVGVEFRPIEDLLLRGTVSTVFRAPSISEVFQPPVSSAPLLSSDPCDFIAPTPTTPNPNAGNPACAGVPATGTFIDQFVANAQQINAITSGSAYAGFPLGPEQGKSFDFGVVYSPHFVPGLSVSADIWRIYLNDTITSVGVQTVLDLCFAGVTQYCPMVDRIQAGPNAGQPGTFLQPTANLGRVDVTGVDFAANYRLPAFSFGQFTIGLNATYMKQFKIQTAPGQEGNTVINSAGVMGTTGSSLAASCPFAAGAICFFPRIKAQGNLGWQLGPWDAQWTMRYSHSFEIPNEVQSGLNVQGFDRYGSYVYNDVTVGYNIEPINTRIDIGVDNVFDKEPPMLWANHSQNANTDPNDFDTLGRYYWGRVTVKF
jgi:outer membrane receptor protein involved in Fe transport